MLNILSASNDWRRVYIEECHPYSLPQRTEEETSELQYRENGALRLSTLYECQQLFCRVLRHFMSKCDPFLNQHVEDPQTSTIAHLEASLYCMRFVRPWRHFLARLAYRQPLAFFGITSCYVK